jgi:hypothetical protein
MCDRAADSLLSPAWLVWYNLGIRDEMCVCQ